MTNFLLIASAVLVAAIIGSVQIYFTVKISRNAARRAAARRATLDDAFSALMDSYIRD